MMIPDVAQYHRYIACVMLYCVLVYIDSGCCCVDFHLQLQLEVVWRQVEDPSNPGHFYYYNQAWRPKKFVEEFDDSQQRTFEATGETTWEVPAEFAEVRHWVVMGSLMLCVFLIRQEDFGISGNQEMFLQKDGILFCSIIWIRWLVAKKWFSVFIQSSGKPCGCSSSTGHSGGASKGLI